MSKLPMDRLLDQIQRRAQLAQPTPGEIRCTQRRRGAVCNRRFRSQRELAEHQRNLQHDAPRG